jgi:serine protease
MMAVRVMDTPWRMPFVSDFIAALDYMIATPEVRVAAIPLTYEYSGALEAAAQAAVDNGIVLVCAAGNAGVHVPWPPPNGRFFPGAFANIKGVISVGASDCNDAPYQFTPPFYSTNWGETTVDVFAPGENRLPVLDGVYGFTSGASSLVAGIVSLYLAENPSATPADVEELIVNTARQVPVLQAFPANQNNPACRAGGVINAAAMFGLPASCPPIEPCDP